MFTTFSKTMSDPSTRNRMVAYTTQASASTSMKGSSQARTPARCNRWAYVDISISLGQRPGKRWPNGKLVSGQECTHTSMALPAHARTRRARIPLPGAPARFGAFCDRHRGRKITRTVQKYPALREYTFYRGHRLSTISPRLRCSFLRRVGRVASPPPPTPSHTHRHPCALFSPTSNIPEAAVRSSFSHTYFTLDTCSQARQLVCTLWCSKFYRPVRRLLLIESAIHDYFTF